MEGPTELSEFKRQAIKKSDEFKQRMNGLKLKNEQLQRESDLAREKITESTENNRVMQETIKALKLEFEGFRAGKDAYIEKL